MIRFAPRWAKPYPSALAPADLASRHRLIGCFGLSELLYRMLPSAGADVNGGHSEAIGGAP